MNTKKVFKRVVLSAVTLMVIAGVLLFTMDLGFLRGTIEAKVRESTGRSFSIGPDPSIRLGRDLVVHASDVTLGNPGWAADGNLARMSELHAVIDVRSLLSGPVLIRAVELSGLEAGLLQNEAGQTNWQIGPPSNTDAPAGELPFLVESITLNQADIEFYNPRLDQPIKAIIESLQQNLEPGGQIHARLSGTLNGQGMTAEVTGGPYSQLTGGDNFKMEGSGSFGRITAKGSAIFDNLWDPRRPLFDLQISGPDVEEFTRMLGIESLAGGELSFTAASSVDDDQLAVRVNGQFGELIVDFNSEMSSLQETAGASFRAQLSGPNFGRVARLAGFEGWPQEAFDIDMAMDRPDTGLEIDRFNLSLAGADIELTGSVPGFPEMSGAEIKLQVKGQDLAKFREAVGIEGLPAGEFSLAGDISTGSDGTTGVDVQYETPLAKGAIEGVLGGGKQMIGTDLRFTADGGDARELGNMLEISGLAAKPWSVRADMVLQDPAFYELRKVVFETTGIAFELQGKLGAESMETGTALQFSVSGDRMADFQELAGEDVSLPELAFSLTGNVEALPDSWKLSDVTGNTGDNGFTINGQLGKGESMAGSKLALEASGSDLGSKFELPDEMSLPDGPFTLQANIGLEENHLSISQAVLGAGDFSFKLDADLPWPLDMTQGGFDLNTSGPDINSILTEFAGITLDPNSFAVQAAGDWHDGKISVGQGNVRIGESAMIVKGTLDLPPNLSGTDMNVGINSPDLSQLGTIDGARWGTLPFEMNTSFTGSRTRFQMEQFLAQLGESSISGDFSMDFEPETPQFDLKLTSDSLDLRPFLVDPDEEGSEESPGKDDRLIPGLVFPTDAMSWYEGRFAVTADRILLETMTLQNTAIEGELREGALNIREIGTDGYQGRLLADLKLVPLVSGGAQLTTSVRSEGLILNLSKQTEDDRKALPAFDIDIKLSGNGQSLREAAAAFQGNINIISDGGQVRNVRSESAAGLFLSEIVSAISPSESRQEVINISCFAAGIGVTEGVLSLDPGIALQSDKLNIFATGKLNLATEKIDVNFRTETRKAVSLSTSELVSPYVKLSGTLSAPSVALDPKGTLLSGGAAYLSGGLSILAKKALDQLGTSESPCADQLPESEQEPARKSGSPSD